MDKERELASKVDALVKRHGAPAADDRNIPVLSEIVNAPEWKPAEGGASSLEGLSRDAMQRLANEIFARVFERIDAEIVGRLEERITERLAAQVNAAVAHVLSDLRSEIANSIGDAVNDALARHVNKK
jgi:hypothetical protein